MVITRWSARVLGISVFLTTGEWVAAHKRGGFGFWEDLPGSSNWASDLSMVLNPTGQC